MEELNNEQVQKLDLIYDISKDLNFNIKLDDTTDSKTDEQNAMKDSNPQNNSQKIQQNNDQNSQIEQVQQQQPGFFENYNLKKSGHPIICLLTFMFKLVAFLCYFLIGDSSEVTTFILVILFSACDFWITKNITGRILIGLRYWSDFNDKGDILWIFESPNQQFKSNPIDASFFWTFQILGAFFWGLIFIFKLISFHFLWVNKSLVFFLIVLGFIMYYLLFLMLCKFAWVFQMSWRYLVN